MSDDGKHVSGGNHFGRGCDHVGQKRLAADLMQHLGMFGLQPRPFTRRQYGDGDFREAMWVAICSRHSIQYTARALCRAGLRSLLVGWLVWSGHSCPPLLTLIPVSIFYVARLPRT